MKSKKTILYEYEEILLGKNGKDFKTIFNGSLEERRKVAGVIWRYAISNLLRWTPEQAETSLTKEIIESLCLDKTYSKMEIEYGVRKFFDIRSVLRYAFPEKIKFDVEKHAIEEYKRVMKLDEWKYDNTKYRFHKGFFRGPDGAIRSQVILSYAIAVYFDDVSNYALYRFFGDEKEANQWLEDHRLGGNVIPGFKTSLELLHYSLPQERGNKFYYLNEYIRSKVM